MTKNKFSRLKMMSSLWISSLLAGCMTVAPLEPVKNAPLEFRGDNTVAVEFVSPMLVGARCAQRGAHIFGVPQLSSMGCGDGRMITMPNPCQTITSGWYARLLCHELAHANGWSRTHEGGSYLPDEMAGVNPQAIALSESTIASFEEAGALKPASQSPQALALAEARSQAAGAEAAPEDARMLIASAPHEQTAQETVTQEAQAETEFSSRVQLASTSKELQPSVAIFTEQAASATAEIGLRAKIVLGNKGLSTVEPAAFTIAQPISTTPDQADTILSGDS
ncbi:hypothetical protein [Henriciella marina]|uniref:hypothetical protein n=1 Tax=Henriciella marina TaxID=453851 RepID=UPI0012EAF00C|nr:hypothetical protein [Henriciella marina]